jgi:hypothetical protein
VTEHNHCPHQWNQAAPFTPAWVLSMTPTTACPPPNHTETPNPVFTGSATLPMCTPLEIKKIGPCSVLVTVSIPAESIFTLPTKALEIKMIRKNLKLTQCRYFNCFPPVPGIPHDPPKLFVGGSVRKDIQYSEAIRQTATTVEGVIKDFVVNIPFTCVIDLCNLHAMSPILFSQRQEYEFSGEPTEFNVVSQQFLNLLPNCELIFSQINEMDDALDRVPLAGGPCEEGVFRSLQEKMVILIQLKLTFPTEIDLPHPHCHLQEPRCNDNHCSKKVCCGNHLSFFSTPAKLLHFIRRGFHR